MFRLWPVFLIYQENLLSVENVGDFDPIGSKIIQMLWLCYLNIGIGCAWARHSNAKLYPTGLINHANLSSVENVGGLEPTGSGNF